jgi:hypothetical protein
MTFPELSRRVGRIPALARGTATHHIDNQDSVDSYFPGDLFFGQFDSQARRDYLSATNQLRHNPINRVHWNGKPDSRRSSRRAIDLGINTDQPSGAVE